MRFKTALHWLAITSLALILGLGDAPFSLARVPADPAREIAQARSEQMASEPDADEAIQGPFVNQSVGMAVFNGDLRDLPQLERGAGGGGEVPQPSIPGKGWPSAPPDAVDPVAQTDQGLDLMPDPIANFEGIYGPEAGGWAPPDTNGDVGPNHYVQTVNIGIGMYDKATGTELVNVTFDDFFDGTGTSCDDQNRGDPISLYDPMADRWLISDFSLPTGGPYLECIAVSQTGDPVSGGWYFYAFDAGNAQGSWHDYPKLGVWPDAYYMSANMFDPWAGAKVWAFDRTAMLNGDPVVDVITFDTSTAYASLLPGNLRGPLPPADSPNYFAAVSSPNLLRLWAFDVDWSDPGSSTFTGPTNLTVANFSISPDIPQRGTGQMLDSLSPRLMMQLQYRNFGSHESLWVNHTVASGGVAGVRWYEVRDPGGTPVLYQQGTYQPADGLYRWMGSLAVDQEGNMALGYSVSGDDMYPAIRYTGRLAGDPLGTLPQGETSLIEGGGAQTGTNRWGDYSAMTVDPVDDCTFWYTQEYYEVSSARNWYTRIGSFRFPSCGQPQGGVTGTVYDADTLEGIGSVLVVAENPTQTLPAETDPSGQYTMTLPGGAYTLTAGPLAPGYPDPVVVPNVIVTAGLTVTVDIPLVPQPYLVEEAAWVDDAVPDGNGNGYPEPGEGGLLLWETLSNTGATTATNVSAHLVALTPGVTVTVTDVDYPNVSAGEAQTNLSPFEFSIAPTVDCGGRLDFQKIITADQGVYTIPLKLYAGVPLPPAPWFADDMESGSGGWSTGGTNDRWAITEEQSHSPTHAWSDSPNGDYSNNTNAWLQSPVFDLSQGIGFELGFWGRYGLESGYDYGYLEYSLNGGADWTSLDSFNGFQSTWDQESYDVAMFDEQPNVAFRFRLYSDGGVTEDGWYIDDVILSYQPFECTYPAGVPTLLAPPDGTITGTYPITFAWQAGPGGAPDGYNLELDDTVFTTTGTTSATILATGVHTWRVRAFTVHGYSDWTEVWTLEVLDPPGTPTLLAPPDDTLTSTHQITFAWETGSGGPIEGYHLELNGTIITATETFWTAVLDAGSYAWRVRAFNPVGYSDWSPAWTLEVLDPPGTPALLAPPDGTFTSTRQITFAWEAGSGGPPDGYNLELDGGLITTTATNSATVLATGVHTWRVRAFNPLGYSDWSPAWTLEVLDPPATPALLAPPDGALTSTRQITFAWEAGSGGPIEGYHLDLSGTVITTTETFSTAILDAGSYAWRVRAYNVVGYSDWTSPWTIQVTDCLAITGLTFVPTEAYQYSPVTFSASVTPTNVTRPITYTWDFGDGSPPTTALIPTATHTYRCGPQTVNLTATNACSQQSVTQNVTVHMLPCCVPPEAGFTYTLPLEVGTPITFTNVTTWCTVYPITYTWNFGDGSPLVASVDASHTYTTPGRYIIWLTASMDCGCDDWIDGVYSQTLSVGVPGVPTLLAPPDGAVTTTQAITFTWQAGGGGAPAGYRLGLDGGVVTTTDPSWAGSLGLGVHTWRVQAFNGAGASDWTETWTVEVTQTQVISPPGVPTLVAPLSGTVTTTQELSFVWQAGSGGAPDGYHLELGGQVLTTTAPTYSATLGAGLYTWRVRAFNSAGNSDWTEAWTLTVAETYRVYLPIVFRDN